MQGRPADFFLGSSEHRDDWATARSCWLTRSLHLEDGRECALVEIDPAIIGQRYGLGDRDLVELILVARNQEHPLSQVIDQPVPVLVYRILSPSGVTRNIIRKSDIRLTAWGEIYSTLEAAQRVERKSKAV